MPEIDTAVTVVYMAWDTGNSVGKTGDASNHTLRGVSDGTEFTPSGSPSQIDATNLPGLYKITLTAGENDGAMMTLGGKSSTSNIVIIPVQWTNKVNATQIEGSDATTQIQTAAQAGAQAALQAYDLDHLIETTAGSEEPTDGSYLDQVMHKDANQQFNAATDSLEALGDKVTSTGTNVQSAISGGQLTIRIYDTLSESISALGDISGRSKLWFAIKTETDDEDNAAIAFIEETDGLTRLEGAAYTTAADGSLTVTDANAGDLTLAIKVAATSLLSEHDNVLAAVKMLTSEGVATTLREWNVDVVRGTVRAKE